MHRFESTNSFKCITRIRFEEIFPKKDTKSWSKFEDLSLWRNHSTEVAKRTGF
jgi:hypothetical protein